MRMVSISDKGNYESLLKDVEIGSPVYLVIDGKRKYTIRRAEDDQVLKQAEAMVRLLSELNKGIETGEREGWLTKEEVRMHFSQKRKQEEAKRAETV